MSNTSAFAYASGSIGYDISYLQCGGYASSAIASVPPAFPARFAAGRAALAGNTVASAQSGFPSRFPAPPSGTSNFRTRSAPLAFGIVGVDSGYPFMSTAHPGNPCLASQYAGAPSPGLYINTGYDQSYTDANHTTPNCATQSAAIQGTPDQQKAWAVGCSEAEDDYGYAQSKGIASPVAWWLDVETGNSWCGLHGVTCDASLNQFTIQGIIDTFTHIGAVPIGIYSNKTQWSAIMGNLTVTGVSANWVASGQSAANQAATYCNSGSSFTGAPVTIVQYLARSSDLDYAC